MIHQIIKEIEPLLKTIKIPVKESMKMMDAWNFINIMSFRSIDITTHLNF